MRVSEAATKTKKPNRETQIRLDMEAVGTYNPVFDKTIHDLARRERELGRAERAWRDAYTDEQGKRREPQMVVETFRKDGTIYRARDPYYIEVARLQAAVEKLREQLGLTAKSLQRVKETQKAAALGGRSRIEQLLADAEEYATEMAESYREDVEGFVDAILAGRKKANIEQAQACERYRRDLQNPAWEFRPERANTVIAIIETTMCHQQGEKLDATPLRGEPFLLLPYHKFIIYNVMGFYLAGTNERRFKEALDFVPRKNVKTTFAEALAWAIALYERASGATVYEIAGSLKQAMEGFGFLKYNLRRLHVTTNDDPAAGLRIVDNNTEHCVLGDLDDGSISINALATPQDSFNASIIIADELHTYKSPKPYQLMKDATKAYTNKLVIGISSGGDLAQGFCAKRVEFCKKILNGTVTGPEAESIFAFIAQAPTNEVGDVDYTDPAVLEAANPAWGESIRPQDMINDAMQAKHEPDLRPEFLQKSLNVFTAAMRAWFDIEEWRRSDRKYNWTPQELAKLPVKWYGGTDLSKLHDLTAACLFGNYNGVDIILPHCWFPRAAAVVKAQEDEIPLFGWMDDGWLDMSNDAVINHGEVVKWYKDRRAEGFKIRRIGHDRKFVREYFLAMQQAHFPIKDQPQTFLRKSEGFRYLEASAKRGTLYYCHAEPMEYCVQNVRGIEKADDMVMYEKISEHLRIDVFDCAVFATCAYLDDLDKVQKVQSWFGDMKGDDAH